MHPQPHLDDPMPDKDGGESLHAARILVVEDEAIVAMDVQFTLEDAGAEVVGPARTLTDAKHLAEHEDISAAILDLRLGRESAGAVARVLTQRGIPFVFYTGQTAADPLRAEWPDAPLLQKPATTRELVQAIAQLLK